MRLALAVAVTAALLLPCIAVAGPAECQRFNRQISHYQAMVERARELDNPMWEQVMRLASRAALAYFTFGAF